MDKHICRCYEHYPGVLKKAVSTGLLYCYNTVYRCMIYSKEPFLTIFNTKAYRKHLRWQNEVPCVCLYLNMILLKTHIPLKQKRKHFCLSNLSSTHDILHISSKLKEKSSTLNFDGCVTLFNLFILEISKYSKILTYLSVSVTFSLEILVCDNFILNWQLKEWYGNSEARIWQ